MKKKTPKRVLLVENDPEDARQIADMFKHQGHYAFELTLRDSIEGVEKYLLENPVDIVLLSLELPDAPGMEAVRLVMKSASHVSIVVLCNTDNEAGAVEAIRSGAQDYLLKGQIEPCEMMRSLRSATERKIVEDALFIEKDRAQVTLDAIGDGVICADVEGKISYLNPVAETMTGWSLADAIGRPLAETFRISDDETGETTQNPMVGAMGQKQTH